ncbi:MAG: flagellar M-ring protein FliF, partial [Candidatus Zixiibacteriota bacterium]
MDAMKRLFEHFYGVVGRMAPSQILLGAIVVIGMIVGTIMIVSWAKDQYYAPLYTGLSSEDAGNIVERLKEMKIQYQIGDNGGSISVPSNDVYETRMKLATAGLPSPQNIGYALLDQTNIGMTDFLQKVNYRRALEGELVRTITGLSEVAAARVHLVIPEDRLFREDQHTPTASVVVKLQGGMPLNKRQLQGVAYLVASSVEGMTPDKVTIIDSDGNLLSGMQASDESAMLSATQFDMRKNIENYLEQKAQSLMSDVIGAGRAVVRVTAELNFEKSNTQIEQYDPDLVAIRSEQRTTQKGSQLEGALAQTSPTAGADGAATIPTTPAATNTTSDNSEDVITNYEVSRTIRNIIGQNKSAFDFRKVMDEGKILIINLSKGRMGEENSNFLGLVMVPRLLAAAMSRADVPEAQRRPFYLYVDEFQNYATPDFATILSEARKYKLNMIVANQFT